jgi:hypothetical protein
MFRESKGVKLGEPHFHEEFIDGHTDPSTKILPPSDQ